MTDLAGNAHPATDDARRPAPSSAPAASPAKPSAVAQPVTPPVVPPPHVQSRPEPRRPGGFRRFVRSVFSHLIFAALVTAGVFGYVYQDMILGRVATTVCGNDVLGPYTLGGSKSIASTPAASGTAPAVTATAPAPAPAPTPAPAVVAAPAHVPQPDSTPAVPPAAATATDAKPAVSEAAKSESVVSVPAPSAPSSVAAATPVPPAAPAAALPPQTPPKPAAIAPSQPVAAAPGAQDQLTSAWRAAREAYNAGKPDAADAYKALLRAYPDVPDLAGELGNLYYSAGKWREASESYYEAAQRYLRSPQPGYAACLLDVLRNLRSPDADRLAPQITRPCPTTRTGQPDRNQGQTASNPPRG